MSEAQCRDMLAQFARDIAEAMQRLEVQVLNLSQALAEKEHGTAAVKAACQWAGDSLGNYAAEAHPYDVLMQTYKASQAH